MPTQDFTTTISVDQTPTEVFQAINNPRGWWSEEIEGATDKLDAEFTCHCEDLHRCKMKIVEFVRDQKVIWLVLDNYFDFTEDTICIAVWLAAVNSAIVPELSRFAAAALR